MTLEADGSGRRERERSRRLVAALPTAAAGALRLGSIDLAPSVEHLVYTALRQPAPESTPPTLLRALGRLGPAAVRARPTNIPARNAQTRVLVLVTRPVHVTLYAPVHRILLERGIGSVVVDAETRDVRGGALAGTDGRLATILRRGDVPRLAAHAIATHARLERVPAAWAELLGKAEADRLLEVVQRGLPLVALEVARVDALLARVEPDLVVCFSESGLLARIAPAVARARSIPSVDLPHAEAADPWGVAGAGYDGFAVYGPRSRRALETGGIDRDRIVEIGPLRYDALLARPRVEPRSPALVVFASQPSDRRKPATHPDVKRAALAAARAAAAALAPAELVVVPHPNEAPGEADAFVADLPTEGIPVRVDRELGLHALLNGAWLLVTASSQSVFEAVVSGVPAMTVSPTGRPDPVTFAAEGIAIGVGSEAEAAAAAARLRNPARRRAAVADARGALGDRIGPLDGRAADRAAEWLQSFIGGAHHARPSAGRG